MSGHQRIEGDGAERGCAAGAEGRSMEGGAAGGRAYEKPVLRRLGLLREMTKRTNSALIQNNSTDHTTTVTW